MNDPHAADTETADDAERTYPVRISRHRRRQRSVRHVEHPFRKRDTVGSKRHIIDIAGAQGGDSVSS
ncbi:hypothetical protein GCM10023193_22760 [Planotetraspora kaengkrachanensis]|uniref:Uncharacterized protein n=1 Tax=Planotetraspora kaengkrachanensis TaxID=575193 RepID=A0A8J3PRP3_9ACTN|nr:hypothetical protein Pka01_31380 [Planotetraspora kaengkrachanensis]